MRKVYILIIVDILSDLFVNLLQLYNIMSYANIEFHYDKTAKTSNPVLTSRDESNRMMIKLTSTY